MSAVAPVGQGPIDIDADEIDGGVSPHDIERKARFRAAAEHMRAVLRPVRRVGNFCPAAEQRLAVVRQRRQRLGRRIDAGLERTRVKAASSEPTMKASTPPASMQSDAQCSDPERPFVVGRRRRAEKRRNLRAASALPSTLPPVRARDRR